MSLKIYLALFYSREIKVSKELLLFNPNYNVFSHFIFRLRWSSKPDPPCLLIFLFHSFLGGSGVP